MYPGVISTPTMHTGMFSLNEYATQNLVYLLFQTCKLLIL